MASLTAASLLYPDATPLLPTPINPNVKAFLSLHKDLFPFVEKKASYIEDANRLIVVDTADWERLANMAVLRKKRNLEIFVWDHHTQPGNIEASWTCREPVGANITLMMRSIKAEKIKLTPIQATLFLAGLYEDTGQLTFPGTTAEDAYTAGALLEQGGDLAILTKFLRPAYGEKQKDILFKMLQNARREKINGHSISISKLSIDGHVGGLALVVNMYRDIMNVDVAFGIFCKPEDDGCMVIGRGDVESLNIGSMMRTLGGGGHPGAGSAMLRQVNPDAVVETLVELASGNQQSSVQISDLMSFPVHTISPGTSMDEAERRMRVKGCTGLPVVDGGRLVGMISRRDFQKIRRENQLKSPVKAYMQRSVQTIEPGKSPLQAAKTMTRRDIGRLPVVDNGQLIGIVTRSDVMCYFYDLLPE